MPSFILKNNLFSVSVNSFGAELSSLKNNFGHELIWQADKTIWARHAPVLFPIVGKLKDNSYSYQNKKYSLSQHGFARDKEFILIHQTPTQLQFELTACEESLLVYPFHFSLIIGYELLENILNITYKVFNPTKNKLFFSLGAHPGFNCKRIIGESLTDFVLEFENTNELVALKLNNGIRSNETYKVNLRNNELELNTGLFDNDALVFKNKQIEKVKLKSKKTNSSVTLICNNWPYFGIWTKKGCNDFVCLEPWMGIADEEKTNGKLEEKEGINCLAPYKTLEATWQIEVK